MASLEKTLLLSGNPKLIQALNEAQGNDRTLHVDDPSSIDSTELSHSDIVIYPLVKEVYQSTEFKLGLDNAYPGQIRIGVYEDSNPDFSHTLQHSHGCINLNAPQEEIAAALNTKLSVRQALDKFSLASLAGKTIKIPCNTHLRTRVQKQLEQGEVDNRRLAQYITKDVGLLARVLMLANIDAMPSGHTISNVYDALEQIDKEALKFLMGADGPLFEPQAPVAIRMLKSVTDHSTAVARLALMLALEEGRNQQEQHLIFSTAMLHEIGRLFLAAYETEAYDAVFRTFKEHSSVLFDEENKVFKTTYTELGAEILRFWKIPESITRMVAVHQNPYKAECSSDDPVWVLHSANTIIEETSPRGHYDPLLHSDTAPKLH